MSSLTRRLFDLPCEIRCLIFSELWKSTNRVAAFDKITKTGILAYYDGHVLDESDITTYSQLRRKDVGAGRWRPNDESGLPTWLLSSKLMMREGMEEFYRNAHWNVWPVGAHHNFSYTSTVVENMLMQPKYATSMSLARLLLDYEHREDIVMFKHEGVVPFFKDVHDVKWSQRFIESLGNAPSVKNLKVSIAFAAHYITNHKNVANPFGVDVPFPYKILVQMCKKLDKMEVELFHHEGGWWSDNVFEKETVEQMRPGILASLQGGFTEQITTKDVIVDSRLLSEQNLIYTRSKSEEKN
ncbi:hypothetical protein BDU57DRAFT_563368 [Ampelomyces quisqualis]|uniref:F-box domain-containing protein n=1 Tax=Ampelomyces quisqualis TaxID=50730 RepID=A0A6A5R068_AMPQU|nr:hypothetical protein BDU57DRAFT_563368 [Ampelomyces quisqualis]